MRTVATTILALGCALALTASPALAGGKAERLLAEGTLELNTGRHESALEIFTKALAADPALTEALYYRGVAHGKLGNYNAAAVDFTRVLVADPDFHQAELDLGYTKITAPVAGRDPHRIHPS